VKRVLVVARAPAARAGLQAMLARSGAFSVVGAGARGSLAGSIAELEPDVVVVALERGEEPPLPVVLPPDAAARAPAVVVLGPAPLDGWAPRALRLGARGVLERGAAAAGIVAAVEAAAAGLVVLPPGLAVPAARGLVRAAPGGRGAAPSLSPRELAVLQLVGAGLGNRAIAEQLAISEHTVKTHMAGLFAKLGVSTRAEAVAAGVRAGLLML